MDLIIYSYGYSELIFHALQGLAMIRETAFYSTIINTVVLTVGVFYAIQMSSTSATNHLSIYIKKFIGMIIFVNALLLPKTHMIVRDHVENSIYKVDNIPLAFALPISVLENFGHLLTMGFEQAFSRVNGTRGKMYYNYGTVFGARLAKDLLTSNMTDPVAISNLRHFIERCVILPAMIGHKFTKEELVNTQDIWGLVSRNAGTITRFSMIKDNEKTTSTCKDAIAYFEKQFERRERGIIAILSEKFRNGGAVSEYTEGARVLNRNLKAEIMSLYDNAYKVDAILKNNIMINAINDWRSGKFATARAQMHHEASGLLAGDIADKTLTGSLAVMKVFVYTSFIFLFPLLIISGGISKYTQWIVMAFSLSLWPPLFAILNMMIDFAYDPPKIVSYSTWSTEFKRVDSIASIAAGLTLSIPFLAYWVTKIGEGGFSHLVGTITASGHSTASAVAHEMSTGSRSWDNDSVGNTNIANNNAYKTNHNLEYASGEVTSLTSDGASIKMSASGHEIVSGGPGITSDIGETVYSLKATRVAEAMLGSSESMEAVEANSKNFSFAKMNTFNNAKNWVQNLAQREAAGEIINYESMGESGSQVQKIVSHAKSLSQESGNSWSQAVEGALCGSIAGIIGGKMNLANVNSKNFGEKSSVESDNALSSNLTALVRAAKSHSYSRDSSVDTSESSSLYRAYEEQETRERALSRTIHEARSWQRAKNILENSAGDSSRDMTRSLIDRYMKESGIRDRVIAHAHVSEQHPAAMQVWSKMQAEDQYTQSLVSDIMRSNNELRATKGAYNLENIEREVMQDTDSNTDSRVNSINTIPGIQDMKNKLNMAHDSMTHDIQNEHVVIESNMNKAYGNLGKKLEERGGGGVSENMAHSFGKLVINSFYNSERGENATKDIEPEWVKVSKDLSTSAFEAVDLEYIKKQ